MSRTVSLAVIVMMNAILALVMATSLTGGAGSGAVSRSLLSHVAPGVVEAPAAATTASAGGGFAGLTFSADR